MRGLASRNVALTSSSSERSEARGSVTAWFLLARCAARARHAGTLGRCGRQVVQPTERNVFGDARVPESDILRAVKRLKRREGLLSVCVELSFACVSLKRYTGRSGLKRRPSEETNVQDVSEGQFAIIL